MSQVPDDLDALLASLLVTVPDPVAESAPLVGQPLPELSAEDVRVFVDLRAWLDNGAPGGTWQPPRLDSSTPEAEVLEPEILLELAAARAWRSGDLDAFDKALSRLPEDRAAHHRRMARACDLIRARQEARTSTTPAPGGRS